MLFVALVLAGCGGEAPSSAPSRALPVEPEVPPMASTCGAQGFFKAGLSGALTANVDWSAATLRCESMRRPDDRGVRLRFSGEVAGERLAIIIAMPELDPGATGPEFDSNITINVEGSGRFFSTPNLGSCWTEVHTNDAQADGTYVVAGALTCVGPLGEFNGDAFVEVNDLQFSGIADWEAT